MQVCNKTFTGVCFMEEISQEELNERVAILRRFRTLLEQQRAKFQEYLNVLEKQQNSICAENTDAIVSHAELEQQVVSSIGSLQKVIVPMSKLYAEKSKGNDAKGDEKVENIQKELSQLQVKILAQNEKNRQLLTNQLSQITSQIASFRNPYKNLKSVYSSKVANASMIEINV